MATRECPYAELKTYPTTCRLISKAEGRTLIGGRVCKCNDGGVECYRFWRALAEELGEACELLVTTDGEALKQMVSTMDQNPGKAGVIVTRQCLLAIANVCRKLKAAKEQSNE